MIKHKFNVGDWVRWNDTQYEIVEISDDGYHCDNAFIPFSQEDETCCIPFSKIKKEFIEIACGFFKTNDILDVKAYKKMKDFKKYMEDKL